MKNDRTINLRYFILYFLKQINPRNDCARGHFELAEKIVCKHFNHQFRCKHYNVF